MKDYMIYFFAMDQDLDQTWVVIAAYNEESAIAGVLSRLSTHPYRVVVVDDGSTDGTVAQVLDFPVVLLRHAVNLGQGAALQTGITYALNHGAHYLATFDADGQHDPEDIGKLLEACRTSGCDVALGTRFAYGGTARNIKGNKRTALRVAIWLTRWMTGLDLTDTHNGLRLLTRNAAQRIRITQNGMAHASEILNQIADQKMTYIEVPVTIQYTHYSLGKGQSIWNGFNVLWELLAGRIK